MGADDCPTRTWGRKQSLRSRNLHSGGASPYARISVILLALGSLNAAASSTAAQQSSVYSVLVTSPYPDNPGTDSAYVAELGTDLRHYLFWRLGYGIRTIKLCDETDLCETLLDDETATDVALRLKADLLVTGRFTRNSAAPRVDLDVMDTGEKGGVRHRVTSLAIQANAATEPHELARMISEIVADTLTNAVRAARDARDCWLKTGENDYRHARLSADRAFHRLRNHPSAALCLSYVFAATSMPDSVIWALERAVLGDSTLADAWERLGHAYLGRGDTTAAVHAYTQEVQAEPDNPSRRLSVVRRLDRVGQHGRAVSLARTAAGDTLSGAFRQLQRRLCIQNEDWECALDALTAQYASNPRLIGDTAFYSRAIGLAQTVGDSAALDYWTREAVDRVDSLVSIAWEQVEQHRQDAMQAERALHSLMIARAAVLDGRGSTDSALAIYSGIGEADPTNVRARILAARLVTRDLHRETGPLTRADSTSLCTADSLLTVAAGLTEDTLMLQSVAHSRLEVAARLVQARQEPTLALRWIEQSTRCDVGGALFTRASAYAALAYVYLIEAQDGRVRAQQECSLVEDEADLIARAWTAITPAQAEFPDLARRVIAGIRVYEELVPQYRTALRCPDE